MQILETTQTVTDGKLVIEVPDYLNNQNVKVIVSSDSEDWSGLPVSEKIAILKAFAGSDRYPNHKSEDYDVYDQ